MTDQPRDLPPNATQVRADDAFDVAALDRWLKSELGAAPDGEPAVRQCVGGASNLTYLLSYPDRELILRRPPAGTKASSAHDMVREYRVQKQLAPRFPLVPEVVALCTDHAVLGADFYVMERIPGVILRSDLPAGTSLDPGRAEALCRSLVDVLVQLHAVDPAEVGLSELGRGPGYVRRQVTGWSGRYRRARTWNAPRAEGVMAWLAEQMPEDAGYCVIHNDFRLDNVVLSPDDLVKPVGVLDWELATLGDPLMDLGCSLAYWVQADDDPVMRRLRRQPTHLPGMLTRAQLLAAYAERTGLAARDFTFYEVYGLFRLAVIIQQIYYRYHHNQSTNPAFRNYWLMAGYLVWRCNRLIARAS